MFAVWYMAATINVMCFDLVHEYMCQETLNSYHE